MDAGLWLEVMPGGCHRTHVFRRCLVQLTPLSPSAGQLLKVPHRYCLLCGTPWKPGDQLCLAGHPCSQGTLSCHLEVGTMRPRRGRTRWRCWLLSLTGSGTSMSKQQAGPSCHCGGDAGLVDITILLLPPSGFAGFLALTTHTHTFTTLGSHRLEGQMLVLSKGADLQKG